MLPPRAPETGNHENGRPHPDDSRVRGLRHLLQERSVLAHDAPGAFHARETLRCTRVPGERIPVFFIRGQIWKRDQGQRFVSPPGEPRGQEISGQVSPASPYGLSQGAGVGFEVAVLVVIDLIADAESKHWVSFH